MTSIRNLEQVTREWRRAKEMREFLDAYEATAPEDQRTEVARVWLAAARRFVHRLDPLASPEIVPKDLDDDVMERMLIELKEGERRRLAS